MNVLVISAHPKHNSLIRTLRDVAIDEMTASGHNVKVFDLYDDNFNPVLSAFERQNHAAPLEPKLGKIPDLVPYIDALKWCNALVLVYPTWWSGQPAILKGWFDRVLVNEVAWTMAQGKNRIRPHLTHVKRFVVVTAHGSSKFINALEGESGKRTAFRSIRLMFHWRARSRWIAFYGLDNSDVSDREKMIKRLRRRIRRAL